MFVGHYAPALVAATHRKAPGAGTLFVAAQLVDIAFFSFVILGVEHLRIVPGMTAMNPMDLYDMPYTHSLVGSLGWAIGFGLIVLAITKSRGAGLIAGLVVFSHWLLDLLVHRPDLTLAGSPPKFGFGIWNNPPLAMGLETALIAGCFAFYLWKTRAIDGQGRITPAVLALALIVFQCINWFGPPPERADAAMAGTGLAAYLAAAAIAWWMGKHRTLVSTSPATLATH